MAVSALVAVVVATSEGSPTAGRLALFGVAVVAVAVAVGSARLIGVATIPMLGSALLVAASAVEAAWVTATVVGTSWYVAAELAWDAIERRDGIERTNGFTNRRVREVATVVLLTLVTTAGAFALSGLAPARTLFVMAAAIVGLAALLATATNHVRRTSGSGVDVGTRDATSQ